MLSSASHTAFMAPLLPGRRVGPPLPARRVAPLLRPPARLAHSTWLAVAAMPARRPFTTPPLPLSPPSLPRLSPSPSPSPPPLGSAAAAREHARLSTGFRSVPDVSRPLTAPFSHPLPPALHARVLLRMAPTQFSATHADGTPWLANHWFDALAAVHSFSFSPTNVTYHSRMIASQLKHAIQHTPAERFVAAQAHLPTPRSLLQRARRYLSDVVRERDTDAVMFNANLALERIPGCGLAARSDSNFVQPIDEQTLQPKTALTFARFDARLCGETSSSHGYVDNNSGEYFNFTQRSFGVRPGRVEYSVFKLSRDGECTVLATVYEPLCVVHSLLVTDNYVVLALWPAYLRMGKLLFTKAFGECVEMQHHRAARFLVICRNGGGVVNVFEHEATFAFHFINGFERDDEIVFDASCYDDCECIGRQTIADITDGKSMTHAVPKRFVLSGVSAGRRGPIGTIAAAKATSSALSSIFLDDACVSGRYNRKAYRFAYGVSDKGCGTFFGDVAKLDVVSGEVLRWGMDGCFVSEPTFVADDCAADSREDAGWLLVVVLDGDRAHSRVVVLDARNMREVSRADLPVVVPHGFHSTLGDGDTRDR